MPQYRHAPESAHADSLLTLLPQTHDAAGRERIYVLLADLSGDSLELAAPYWEAALAEAHKAGDTYGCKDALDFLVRKFADRDTRRAEKYIALSDSILPGSRHALFRSSLYAYYLWKQMNDNNSIETVTRALEELKGKNRDQLTPEERIEWEFLTGLAIDFSSITTEAYGNIPKAIPYVEQSTGETSGNTRSKSGSTWKRFATTSSPTSICSARTSAPKSRSGNASTCIANGWRWTTVSNGLTATRRAT